MLELPLLSSEILTHDDSKHDLIEGPLLMLQDLWPILK